MAAYDPEESQNFKKLYNARFGDLFGKHANNTMTPEQLYDLAVRYFSWAESEAIKVAETAAFQGRVKESKVHKVRVFTVNGFTLFAGISSSVLIKYRNAGGDYGAVVEWIDSVIYEQKFQLAANGVINASFIGKEMGIDKPASITVETNNNSNASVNDAAALKEAVSSVLDQL